MRGKMVICNGMAVLKEPRTAYSTLFDGNKVPLSHENTYFPSLTYGKQRSCFGPTPCLLTIPTQQMILHLNKTPSQTSL